MKGCVSTPFFFIGLSLDIRQSQFRFSISLMLSLLLHLLAFFLLHYLLKQPQKVAHYITLQVQLVRSSPAPQKIPQKVILTTSTHSPTKITAPPPPQAEPVPVTPPAPQGEAVTGISMPGAIASPLSSFNTEGNAFFRGQHAQQDAMRAYQEQMMAEQARYQSAQQSKMLIMQLNEVLEKQFSQEPIITGKCILNATNFHFECDSPALTRRASITERIYLNLFISLQKMGGQYNGFIVGKPPARPTVVLISEHQYP